MKDFSVIFQALLLFSEYLLEQGYTYLRINKI